MHKDMFDRLLNEQPQVLLKADMAACSLEDRERVGRALLARLGGPEPLLGLGNSVPLDYKGVDDDLRSLIASSQPLWRRREAVKLITVAGRRALDVELLEIVHEVSGRSGYDDDIELAVYAANALADATDPAIVGDASVLAGQTGVPPHVRAALISALFPARLSVDDLISIVQPIDRWDPSLGRPVVHALRMAVDSGAVLPEDALVWFEEPPPAMHADEPARRLAGESALAAVRAGPDGPHWQSAVHVLEWLLRDQNRLLELSRNDTDALDCDHRRALTNALIQNRGDVDDLVEAGLLRDEDLLWWLDRLDEDARAGDAQALSGVVVGALAGLILDDDNALDAARRRCESSPALISVLIVERGHVLRLAAVVGAKDPSGEAFV